MRLFTMNQGVSFRTVPIHKESVGLPALYLSAQFGGPSSGSSRVFVRGPAAISFKLNRTNMDSGGHNHLVLNVNGADQALPTGYGSTFNMNLPAGMNELKWTGSVGGSPQASYLGVQGDQRVYEIPVVPGSKCFTRFRPDVRE